MTECPTPHKVRFTSKAKAKQYNRQFRSQVKARLWPYECECGAWHLTTQNYDEQKRIRAQIDQHLGRTSHVTDN